MPQKTESLAFYMINGITLYRIITAPLLVVLLFKGEHELFKWLLGVSFFTDLIDGVLARTFKVTSILGARLDSIGDDLTVLVAMLGLGFLKPQFFIEEWAFLVPLGLLFVLQTGFALYRYGKITSFHTYLAKLAALAQGIFLLAFFFFETINYPLFYGAAFITMAELMEEIIIVWLLPQWKSNVRGLWWVLQKKQ
ncbi:MAG: CDP-alcohol phosphatidyltransferase family protein [Bacteroidota bacterium]|jgi:cardiolipin synthase